MPNPATVGEQRLRKTKAQLIDEIDTLEQRAAAIEAANRSSAPMRAKASDRYLANQELADLARFPSENPNPVLRVMPDGTVLYANEAARAVRGRARGEGAAQGMQEVGARARPRRGLCRGVTHRRDPGDRVRKWRSRLRLLDHTCHGPDIH